MRARAGDGCVSVVTERERELFLEFLFFERGIMGVSLIAECDRFCDYYGMRGWVDGRGQPVTDKMACLRLWKVQGLSTKPPDGMMEAWRELCLLGGGQFTKCFIMGVSKIECREGNAVLHCKEEIRDMVENLFLSHIDSRDFINWRVNFKCNKLIYKIL